MGIYERYLALRSRLQDGQPPEHVALVLTEQDLLTNEGYDTLEDTLQWAIAYGAQQVTVYISVLDTGAIAPLKQRLSRIETPQETTIVGPQTDQQADTPIQISVGLSGKKEFTRAVQATASRVQQNGRDPATISEADIERELVFPAEPDLIIKIGEERLADFMLWQSVYSELYFTDVDWEEFGERDYLRAIYEFQTRIRRFGQ